jgi:hypothetical protein
MASSFLPDKDQDLEAWAANFDTKITATPTAYGLVAGDATAFHSLAADFTTKLAAAVNPATRTPVTVQAKDTSRAALRAKARALAKIINAYPPITNAQRVELGLNVRDTTPTPIPPPATKPLLSVDPDGTLRLVDETMPDRRGKPVGVRGALVFTKIDGPAPVDPDDAKFAALATRFRAALPLPPGSNGKTLWVLAQWYNLRGELGPVSAVASTTIAA